MGTAVALPHEAVLSTTTRFVRRPFPPSDTAGGRGLASALGDPLEKQAFIWTAAGGHSHKAHYCGSTSFASSPSEQPSILSHPPSHGFLVAFFRLNMPKTKFIFFPSAADGAFSLYFAFLNPRHLPSLLSSNPTVHPRILSSIPLPRRFCAMLSPCRDVCHLLPGCCLCPTPTAPSLPSSAELVTQTHPSVPGARRDPDPGCWRRLGVRLPLPSQEEIAVLFQGSLRSFICRLPSSAQDSNPKGSLILQRLRLIIY